MRVRGRRMRAMAMLCLVGCGGSAQACRPKVAIAADPVLFEQGVDGRGFFARVDAKTAGLDHRTLAALVKEAEATGSDALIVVKDGRVVIERYFGHPVGAIETMSVTKSVVGLAIAQLVEDGKIASLDDPMSTWFADWRMGPKARRYASPYPHSCLWIGPRDRCEQAH